MLCRLAYRLLFWYTFTSEAASSLTTLAGVNLRKSTLQREAEMKQRMITWKKYLANTQPGKSAGWWMHVAKHMSDVAHMDG